MAQTLLRNGSLSAAGDRFLAAGRWAILLCIFSVPLNKPATNIFIFLALIFSLLGNRRMERWRTALKQPVVLGALIWYSWLLVTAFIAPAASDRWIALSSYKALFYPLIVATLLETQAWRNRGLLAFGASVSLVLLMSWGEFAWLLTKSASMSALTNSTSFTVFKDYTQQGVEFVVLAVLAAAFAASRSLSQRQTKMLWILFAAALINVIFLLQSRTAYLILVPVVLYAGLRFLKLKSNPRHALIVVVVLAIVAGGAFLAPRAKQRIMQSQTEISRYSEAGAATSLGIRLDLWKRTLPIIDTAPLLGHGLGQWQPQYQQQIKGTNLNPEFIMGHPHQEALLILSEQGVAGLAVLAALLLLLWKYAGQLPTPYRDSYRCLLLIYVTAGLANCVLADFTHRHMFIMLLAFIPLVTPALENKA